MGEQGLHGAEEALLSGSQQVLHALLHMMIARIEDGLQEGQHLPHNLIVRVGQQRYPTPFTLNWTAYTQEAIKPDKKSWE